ncbi:hypothetical protein HK097_010893 [Rhizophlyctis rosea]|uniref:Uncharacterized protein n=1 Tax=Rhizophlyctis rosea TaxID=64517 RepID=A0AAD5X4X5_9FUNG|nr:hypothetical protein HK097_010893 [Rhizophlyctis rosea]
MINLPTELLIQIITTSSDLQSCSRFRLCSRATLTLIPHSELIKIFTSRLLCQYVKTIRQLPAPPQHNPYIEGGPRKPFYAIHISILAYALEFLYFNNAPTTVIKDTLAELIRVGSTFTESLHPPVPKGKVDGLVVEMANMHGLPDIVQYLLDTTDWQYLSEAEMEAHNQPIVAGGTGWFNGPGRVLNNILHGKIMADNPTEADVKCFEMVAKHQEAVNSMSYWQRRALVKSIVNLKRTQLQQFCGLLVPNWELIADAEASKPSSKCSLM